VRYKPIWLAPAEVAALRTELLGACRDADWAVLCGALPDGAPDDLYALLTASLHEAGVRVALNTEWEPLCTVLGRHPDLVVLGRDELEQAAGFPIREPSEAIAAIEQLRRYGATSVLASLAFDHAMLVDDRGAYQAESPGSVADDGVSGGEAAAHARDALLAGFLAGGASGGPALVEAVAWSTAAGTGAMRMPGPRDLNRDAVELTWVDALELAR
jgi:1-phosphofructokinase